LVQVTWVPAGIVSVSGVKVKLSILTSAPAAGELPAAGWPLAAPAEAWPAEAARSIVVDAANKSSVVVTVKALGRFVMIDPFVRN
jgi:hypothetical protein